MDQPESFPEQPLKASFLVALKSKVTLLLAWFRNHPQKNILSAIGVVAIVLIATVLLKGFGGLSFFVPTSNYVPVYVLVNDKISKDGAIVVNLPHGVSKTGVESKVAFDPIIKGSWVSSSLSDAVVYKPASSLSLGKHYLVSLQTSDGFIKKDFLVDEDPAVVSVFPDAATGADPASAITIVFNRPMVPITTLSELDAKNIPVTILPETPGKFKWISTRTLQFIPSKALWGSAHYAVTIRSDFVSLDGLSVPSKTYSFTTKELRLDHTTEGSLTYSEPISFYFNQPVDLQKTAGEITLKNDLTHTSMGFIPRYGTREVWDSGSNTNRKVEDRSIIQIVPNSTQNGHTNVWDFSTTYTAAIKNVYPVGGDILLARSSYAPATSVTLTTSPALQEVTLQSDKSNLVSVDLFDPKGSVTFIFYEDIDSGRSSIQSKGLKKISYGKKCDTKNPNDSSDVCVKVDDKSQLILTFDPSSFKPGESVPVTFQKLVNTAGFQINKTPLVTTLRVYPQLQVLSTTPVSNSTKASISDLVLCTNSPLASQEAEDFYKNFHANKYMVFGRWDNAYLERPDSYDSPRPCEVGEYVNKIHYGLLPNRSYTINTSVEDVFGQKANTQVAVQTDQAPKFYLRFQNLQKVYNVTTPEHTVLTYATENFDYVNLSICKISPDAMVRYLATQPSDVSTTSGTPACIGSAQAKIPLKNDQWITQYFQVNLKDYFADPRGQYVLSFSHPQYQNEKGAPVYARTYLSVTNLAVTDNRVNWSSYDYLPDVPNLTADDTRGSVYWVSRIHSLLPETNAKISVYQSTDKTRADSPLSLAHSNTTNTNGLVEFPLVADVAGASVVSGGDSAVISAWADTLSSGGWQNAAQNEKVYLYTDRPIYRPGQQVYVKGLYRVDFDGAFKIFKDNDVLVQISDSKGGSILKQKVPVNEYGTFTASITLPTDAPLGYYTVSVRNQTSSFDVEDYVGAAFETQVKINKDEYQATETAHVSVAGKYYFGVPLDGGTLDYTITSQDFYFDRYTDEYFNFGGGWYNCYDCGYGDTYLKSGKATLDASGASNVDVPLDFTALYKGADRNHSKIFVFHGTIKDKQGKSVSFEKSFIVHRGDYYVGVKADPSFAGVDQSFKLRMKTVDTLGKPLSESGLGVTIQKVSWVSNKRQEVDGGFYSRPVRTLTTVSTKTVSTNSSGDYQESLSLHDAGEYEIDVLGHDSRGNEIQSSSEIYIYGSGIVDVQPTNNATLNITAEKTDVKVGDVAKFIIQNPYPHAKALISIERGRIFSYEVVDISQSIYEYSFPITEEYAPNVYASVVLLSPGPEVKFGQTQFTVDRAEKKLTIAIHADKSSYMPGEKVNLTITATDKQSRPVEADVSVAVADLSVLALKGNPKKDPLIFFYDGFPLTVTTETNVKNLLEETPIPTGTKGGDGGNPADLSKRKRGEFKDTAFWKADVVTNESGVAQVSFTLPDNLTKWQVETVGITKDTKLGVGYQELAAQKDVMTVPIAPRFIIPGDTFMIGAKIFNQTKNDQPLEISLVSPSLKIDGSGRTQKTIKAGETTTVYFNVTAPLGVTKGAHAYTLSAHNKAYNDTVGQSLPITQNMTYESTATAGSTHAPSTAEYLYVPDSVLTDRGGLTIKTSATLAVYLSDAIQYLFAYPYGCSEQLASRLSAIAITKRAVSIPNVGSQFKIPAIEFNGVSYTVDQAVDMGLSQIYDNQTVDGGFSYYKGLRADPYLTVQVLSSLSDIKEAGYTVRPQVITSATQYLAGQVSYFKTHSDTDSLILLAYVLSRVNPQLAPDITSLITKKYLEDTASSNALGYLALLASNGGTTKALKETIFSTLTNRVDIDSRGAYVKSSQSTGSRADFETPEKDTALFLKALVVDHRDYTETDNIIRWLLASRSSDGSWGSTNTSVAAIDSLSQYLIWKKETESSFTLATALDGKNFVTTTFAKQNILSTIQSFLPISQITPNTLHSLTFSKTDNNTFLNTFYYDLSLKYYLPVNKIAPRDEGMAITREMYSLTDTKNAHPLTEAKVGDVVRGVLTLVVPKERRLFSIEDYIPAGFELINFDLATEDQTSQTAPHGASGKDANSTFATSNTAQYSIVSLFTRVAHDLVGASLFFGDTSKDTSVNPLVTYQKFYPDFKELRDDRLFLFAQAVQPGTYTYEYYLRATTPGIFSHLPAVASELYFPENFGRTAGSFFTVTQ